MLWRRVRCHVSALGALEGNVLNAGSRGWLRAVYFLRSDFSNPAPLGSRRQTASELACR